MASIIDVENLEEVAGRIGVAPVCMWHIVARVRLQDERNRASCAFSESFCRDLEKKKKEKKKEKVLSGKGCLSAKGGGRAGRSASQVNKGVTWLEHKQVQTASSLSEFSEPGPTASRQ